MKKALRLFYDDRQSSFEQLINIDKTVAIHCRNFQVFATELHQVHVGLALELLNEISKKRDVAHSFRNNSTFETKNIKSVYYGLETISFLGPKIWELLPSNITDSVNLNMFKSNIKSWKPENRSYRLFRLHVADIGLIEL